MKEPPYYGRSLIVGRIGHYNAPKCDPPDEECVPEITEYERVEEGEWGECIPNEGTWGQGTRTRTVTTRLYESNSCKDEDRLLDESTEEETERCNIPCRTVNPPELGPLQLSVTDTHIRAYFWAYNRGGSLTLYAGFPDNPRRWRKSHDTDSNECGEKSKVSVSYRHRGHSGCLWTLVGSGGINEVVLNRCQNVD